MAMVRTLGASLLSLLVLGACATTPVERLREQEPIPLGNFAAPRDAVVSCVVDEATQQGSIAATHADGQSDRIRITVSELRLGSGHSTRLRPTMDVLVAPQGANSSDVTLRLPAAFFTDGAAVDDLRNSLGECLGAAPRTERRA